jgi:putative membrane protein
VPPDPDPPPVIPDYRFTLANERTFLAWIRTALAFAAGGLAVIGFIPDFLGAEALALSLLILSAVVAGGAYRRWILNEDAMRRDEPLPASVLPRVIALGVAIVAALAAVLYVFDQG